MNFKIPNQFYFVWYGATLPYSAKLAVYSALKNLQADKIILLYDSLNTNEFIQEFGNSVELRQIKSEWFREVDSTGKVEEIYSSLSSLSAKSNLVRLYALWKWGGIYLDMDVLVLKPFHHLLNHIGFCAVEPIAVPGEIKRTLFSLNYIRIIFLIVLRFLLMKIPFLFHLVPRLQKIYFLKENNAVMGSMAKNMFLLEAFLSIKSVPKKSWKTSFIFGTHLLQNLITKKVKGMKVLSHDYFYPIGPIFSNTWFKFNMKNMAYSTLSSSTLLIHWYSSCTENSLKTSIDENWLIQNPTTAFAELVEKYIVKK